MGEWTLFSNHGHVLLYLAGHTDARLRDVADKVGITERAVQKIVRELQDAGYLSISKHGRCNRYRIHGRKSLRHPIESHCTLSRLIGLIVRSGPDEEPEPASRAPATATTRPATPAATPVPPAAPSVTAAEKPPAVSQEPQPAAASAGPKPPAKPSDKPRARRRKEETDEDGPADSRQQGSLF